jgi:hypothetical protein
MSADKVGEVRFPVKASFIAAAVAVGLTIWYYVETKNTEKTLVFAAAVLAAAGAILAAFYAARAIGATLGVASASAKSQADDLAARKRQAALRYVERWNEASMFHVRDVVRGLFDTAHDGEEFQKLLTEKRTNVINFLNFLEEIAIARESGDVDERILRDAFRGVVETAWQRLQHWVGDQRRMRNRPRIWCKLEELARIWAV